MKAVQAIGVFVRARGRGYEGGGGTVGEDGVPKNNIGGVVDLHVQAAELERHDEDDGFRIGGANLRREFQRRNRRVAAHEAERVAFHRLAEPEIAHEVEIGTRIHETRASGEDEVRDLLARGGSGSGEDLFAECGGETPGLGRVDGIPLCSGCLALRVEGRSVEETVHDHVAPFDAGLAKCLAHEPPDPGGGEAVLQEQGEVFLGMGMFRDDRFETMQIGGHGGGREKRTRRAGRKGRGELLASGTFETVRQTLRDRAMGIARTFLRK